MCFSANASFISSAVLGSLGILTLTQTQNSRDRVLASIPLLFAAQQLTEGFIWEGLTQIQSQNGLVSVGPVHLNYIYTFFAFLLWPIILPFGIRLIESNEEKKKWFRYLELVGIFVSLYMAFCLWRYPLVSWVRGHHLEYSIFIPFEGVALSLYGLTVVGSCFLSSHRWIKIFGGVLIVSLISTFIIYFDTFFSVWCFFAAILSSVLWLHFFSESYSFKRSFSTPAVTNRSR